jgi:hypothetical protein
MASAITFARFDTSVQIAADASAARDPEELETQNGECTTHELGKRWSSPPRASQEAKTISAERQDLPKVRGHEKVTWPH